MKYRVGAKLEVLCELHGHAFCIGSNIHVIRLDVRDPVLTYLCRNDRGEEWYVSEEEVVLANPHLSPLGELQKRIYEGNVAAGWWKDIKTGEAYEKGNVMLILSKLALVHSEVSEALEGVRKNLMDDKLPHRRMVEVELADAVIRILDLAGHEGYDVFGAIEEKLAYNAVREDHKIENRLKEGGKQA